MRFFIIIVGTLLMAGVYCQDSYPLADSSKQRQFNQLLFNLRCLVCQNQSVLESSSPFAKKLRQTVYGLYLEGKSDKEIKAFLTARYGDYILFEPPFRQTTWALWLLPIVLLLFGVALFARMIRGGATCS